MQIRHQTNLRQSTNQIDTLARGSDSTDPILCMQQQWQSIIVPCTHDTHTNMPSYASSRYRRSNRSINHRGLYNSIKESCRKQSPLQPGSAFWMTLCRGHNSTDWTGPAGTNQSVGHTQLTKMQFWLPSFQRRKFHSLGRRPSHQVQLSFEASSPAKC